MIWKREDSATAGYYKRSEAREVTLMKATMNFVKYLVDLGDTQEDAEIKVTELSTSVGSLLYMYTLGNTQPLIDAVNNSSLPFMDSLAKVYLVEQLTIV